MSIARAFLLLLAVAALSACAGLGTPRPKPPTLDEIVALSKEGTPPADIIKRIEDSDAVYALSATDIVKLHEQGVADEVLDRIQKDYLEEIRRDEAFRAYSYYGWYYHPFGPYNYYPYPYYWRHRRWR